MIQGTPVRVTWIDIQSHTGWFSDEEASALNIARIVSYGYFVEQNKEVLRVAMDYEPDGKEQPWGDIKVIPNGCVVKMEKVRHG